MGLPMALNLQKPGLQVYAYDLNQGIYEKVQTTKDYRRN